MIRLSGKFGLVLLISLICAGVFFLNRSAAQETPQGQIPPEQVAPGQSVLDAGQNPSLKPEKPADSATLNLHRWGAVTLFHGLPSDRVNAIAEDASGVLWFGTDNGLVRYDGRNVEAAPNESALPSRKILALKLDHLGSLWIGTEAGAARLRDSRIEVLPETRNHAVTGVAAPPQSGSQPGVTIVTADGLIMRFEGQREGGLRSESVSRDQPIAAMAATRLDPNTSPLLKFQNQSNAVLPLTAVAAASSGDWLIGSSGRGLLVNRASELREALIKPPRPYFVSSIYDDGKRVWVAEQASKQAGGLWIWNNNALSRTSLEAGPITAVHGGDDELWVGASNQGAFLLRFENNDVKRLEHLTFENTAGGLRSNHINAIFRDREGVVWFGTDRGVCRYDRSSFRASNVSDNPQSNFVRVALQTADNETWLGTNRGLFKLTANDNVSGADTWAEAPELQGRSVYALVEDNGAVWAGTSGGLFVKSKGGAVFVRIQSAPATAVSITSEHEADSQGSGEARPPTENPAASQEEPSSSSDLPSARERVLAITRLRGHLYAAFYDRGIERVESATTGFTRAPLLIDPAARHAICFGVERDKGAELALWFGTADGELRRFDGSQTTSISLPQKPSAADRAIRAISVVDKRIWIGSSQGLYLRDGDSILEIQPGVNVRSLYVARESSPDNGPREIVWVATQNAGLIKLLFDPNNPDQRVFTRFDTEQGLASQQVFAVAPGANGEIWIGANRGVARHRPSAVEPRLQIRRLVAERIYLPEDLTAELPLPHTHRSFLLEVTGVGSKTFPSQFQYEFTLFDKNKHSVKRLQTSAPQFTAENLQSGPYTIVARAISRDLIYSAPLTVRLRIRSAPFPWTTVLLASLLVMAIAAATWAFRQQLRLATANRALEKTNIDLTETRLRLANETEAERSRIARDLHDQTLADLRHLLVMTDQLPATPSSSLPSSGTPSSGTPSSSTPSSSTPSSSTPSSSTPSSSTEDAIPSRATLRREIEAISSEIRHICEDLSPSALENIGFLPALEWALSNAVAQLPAEEKFGYEFICEPNLEDRLRLSHIEQIQLYRMTQEALNNICRHAHAKHVNMSVRAENSTDLVIEIADDGVGFDGARINKTGHGIANIRSRANLIGAKTDWKNSRPGCRFEIRKEGCVK